MSNPPPVYECDLCAACCGFFMVFASREDAAREPRIVAETQELSPWLKTPKWAYRLNRLPFHESCCFLEVDKQCAIYETRPTVCREFTAGDEPCQMARAARGLPPLQPVDGAGGLQPDAGAANGKVAEPGRS